MEACPRCPLSLGLLESSVPLLPSALPHYPDCYKKLKDRNTQADFLSPKSTLELVVECLVG